MFQTGGKPSTWFPPVGLVELYVSRNGVLHQFNSINEISHENIVFDEETIDKSSRESHNKFKLCIEALDRANKIEK